MRRLTEPTTPASQGVIIIAVLTLLFATVAWSAPYVSYNGEFSMQYPDNWYQVDYNTVDVFLYRHQVDSMAYKYEAVLAIEDFSPFFAGPYVMLSLDTVGTLSDDQIDSVVVHLAGDFEEKIYHMPTAEFLSEWRPNRPNYDQDSKIASFCTEVPGQGDHVMMNLIMMRFYEKGIASFFFYAPDTLYDAQVTVFQDIVNSISTDNYKQDAPKNEVEIADIDTDNDSSSAVPIVIWAALGTILIVLIARLRRKKRASK